MTKAGSFSAGSVDNELANQRACSTLGNRAIEQPIEGQPSNGVPARADCSYREGGTRSPNVYCWPSHSASKYALDPPSSICASTPSSFMIAVCPDCRFVRRNGACRSISCVTGSRANWTRKIVSHEPKSPPSAPCAGRMRATSRKASRQVVGKPAAALAGKFSEGGAEFAEIAENLVHGALSPAERFVTRKQPRGCAIFSKPDVAAWRCSAKEPK